MTKKKERISPKLDTNFSNLPY